MRPTNEASKPVSGDVASRFRSTGPDAFNRLWVIG
jgi:hypothetical protein